ncbi:MAG TPA: hypothetical protein VM688_09025 [Nocardioidaceae bacterium]|nr:hypothetical protein [Nocardioidaceae bacterium]
MKRLLAYVCVLVLASSGLAIATVTPAGATTVKVRLVAAIKNLPVATETRTGYERTKFRLWVDADGDCRDTRDEVLAAESLVSVRSCDVRVGKSRSYYDRQVTTRSSDFDIDHVVPLAEAWTPGHVAGAAAPGSATQTIWVTLVHWLRSARRPTGRSQTRTPRSGSRDTTSAPTCDSGSRSRPGGH